MGLFSQDYLLVGDFSAVIEGDSVVGMRLGSHTSLRLGYRC